MFSVILNHIRYENEGKCRESNISAIQIKDRVIAMLLEMKLIIK